MTNDFSSSLLSFNLTLTMDSTVSSTSKWSIFDYLPSFVRKPIEYIRWIGGIFNNVFKRPFAALLKSDGKGGNEFKFNTFPEGSQPKLDAEAATVKNSFKFARKFGGKTKNCTENITDGGSRQEMNLPAGKFEDSFNTQYEVEGEHDGSIFNLTRE